MDDDTDDYMNEKIDPANLEKILSEDFQIDDMGWVDFIRLAVLPCFENSVRDFARGNDSQEAQDGYRESIKVFLGLAKAYTDLCKEHDELKERLQNTTKPNFN